MITTLFRPRSGLVAICLSLAVVWSACGTPGRASSGEGGYAITELELQDQLMAFADRLAAFIAPAIEAFEARSPDLKERRSVLITAVHTMSSGYIIAAEPNPEAALLDMYAMVVLGRMIYEAHFAVRVGDEVQPLVEAFQRAENDMVQVAALVLQEEQIEALNQLIRSWRQDHPEVIFFPSLRLSDFAADRRRSTLAQTQVVRGLFRAVNKATLQVEEARLLAERGIFLATRLPLMTGALGDLWLTRLTTSPQLKRLLDDLHRVTEVSERLAATAEKLPDDIQNVRQDLIHQGAQELDRLSRVNIERIATMVGQERRSAWRIWSPKNSACAAFYPISEPPWKRATASWSP
jgi:hypothetical protein